MTDKKRKKYDFGGYIDTIMNPEATMQQDVLKAQAKTAELNNSVWLQGLDVLGNTLINAGVNGFVGAVGAEIGAGTLGKGGLLSKQPKGVTFKSQFDKAKQDRLNKNTQQQDTNTQQGKRGWTKFESLMNVGAQFGGGLLRALPALFAQGGIAGEEENMQHVPIEAEGGEMIAMPWDNQAIPIEGASHEQGGVDLNVPVGSKIYSKRVKDAKGKSMAYRKERRDRELKKWEKIVKGDPNNQIARDTLEKVRRNNEIEEANDMAYMQLHKAKKQFSDYIKDVTKDYGKGGGLNIAAARQAIDQHNMQPVEGEREQYFTGAYVKPKLPDYPYLGKWNTLHPSQQPLTIDTVKKYISSKLPGFNFNGLFNSDPTQGTFTPEQEKYFWEELVPYLDDYTYKYDPNKIMAEAKKRHNIINTPNSKQSNSSTQYTPSPSDSKQDNLQTPFQVAQNQQNLSQLGISNIPNINKSNITPPTPNYQPLQYNQAKYEKDLRDGFKGLDPSQFSDSTGSAIDSDTPPTIRQSRKTLAELGQLKTINHTIMETYPLEERLKEFSEWLSNPENRMKGALDIKPPVDNQVGNTSIDNKVKVTKKTKGGIGKSLHPATQQDFNTLYNAIVHRDPTALALLQNINNQPSNNKPSVKVTPKGNKANTTNTTTQVTQQNIEELRKRLPKTITMNGRSYNTDALLNMLTQNPLARLGLDQSISPNDVTSKGSGKSTNKSEGKGVSNKVQQKDISNVNPDYIDKLIQSRWNPLFGFTGGVPGIFNDDTDNRTNTANTGNEVSSNNRYNPNNYSYSPDYMAAMLGLNKDAKTGKYYDPRTGEEISDSILSTFGTSDATGQSQQSNIVSSTSNTNTEQNTTAQNPGATPLATVPSVTANTGEGTNTNVGKGISVQPNAVGSGVNNTTPVVPNNTVSVGAGNTATVPATTSYINGDKIDYKALTSDSTKFRTLSGNIAGSIYKKAYSLPDNVDLTGKKEVMTLQNEIMTSISDAKDKGLTVQQLKEKLAKVLSKKEVFNGQTYGKSKPLTDAVNTIISSIGGNGSKQDNTKQYNTNTNNQVQDNKPPVKPDLNKINLPNPFGSEEEEDKFWENVISGMGKKDNKTKSTSKSDEDDEKKGNNTEEKPSLLSVLGGALNPSFSTQVAGIIHNMFKPMQAVSDNFKGKSQYRNFYRDYGKKSLLELDNMKDNIRQIRDQNLRELSNMQAATTYSNNNNARDINVARAMNLATLSQITDAANKAYADYSSKNNDIHKLRVNTLTDIDSKVMEGDKWADQMNREMRDSFFANKLEAEKAVGMGLQEIGRLINRERFIKELKKHYEEMERERKEAAANKNIKLKSVTTTTGTKTKK